MATPEWMRPALAAETFGVSERTLNRWAASGLVGYSKVGRVLLYRSSDIADVIAAGATPRTVVPMTAPATTPPADDWRRDPFWAGATRESVR